MLNDQEFDKSLNLLNESMDVDSFNVDDFGDDDEFGSYHYTYIDHDNGIERHFIYTVRQHDKKSKRYANFPEYNYELDQVSEWVGTLDDMAEYNNYEEEEMLDDYYGRILSGEVQPFAGANVVQTPKARFKRN